MTADRPTTFLYGPRRGKHIRNGYGDPLCGTAAWLRSEDEWTGALLARHQPETVRRTIEYFRERPICRNCQRVADSIRRTA